MHVLLRTSGCFNVNYALYLFEKKKKEKIPLKFLLAITNNFINIFFSYFPDVLLSHLTYPSFMVFPDASEAPKQLFFFGL